MIELHMEIKLVNSMAYYVDDYYIIDLFYWLGVAICLYKNDMIRTVQLKELSPPALPQTKY